MSTLRITPTTTPSTTSNPFIFPNGDVRIIINHKGERLIGSAISHVLVAASPIWGKFLFPPWEAASPTSSTPESAKSIDFSDDDSEALLLLLNIAHLNYKDVPLAPNFGLILEVAVLCDQYDCVGILKPWIPNWKPGQEKWVILDGQENWLFAAWVFGDEETFENVAKKMLRFGKLRDDGVWVNRHNASPEGPMPPNIIENINRIRLETIDKLLELFYRYIESYGSMQYYGATSNFNQSNESILDILGEIDLWPEKCAKDMSCSVYQMVSTIGTAASRLKNFRYPRVIAQDLRSRTFGMGSNPSYMFGSRVERKSLVPTHDAGEMELLEDIERAVADMESPVLDEHRLHMKIQRDKLYGGMGY